MQDDSASGLALRVVACGNAVLLMLDANLLQVLTPHELITVHRNEKSTHRVLFSKFGGSCRIRTCDQLIKSQLLYQLS